LELGGDEPLGRGWVWNGEAQGMEGNAVKGRGEGVPYRHFFFPSPAGHWLWLVLCVPFNAVMLMGR